MTAPARSPDNDPSFYGIDAGYTAAVNSWQRDVLGFKSDREYQSIQASAGTGTGGSAAATTMPILTWRLTSAKAMRENSGLRVFVAQGYYDFATPFFAAEYALSRTGVPQDRVQFHYYHAGHMMYVRDEDRAKLSRDIRAFIRSR